jgi:hypothetical protein
MNARADVSRKKKPTPRPARSPPPTTQELTFLFLSAMASLSVCRESAELSSMIFI